jgi:hypothetical protein
MSGPPSVIPRDDPRARTLLQGSLFLCCGFYLLELGGHLLLGDQIGDGPWRQLLRARHVLFALGRESAPALAAAVGTLLHAGLAGLLSAALQRTWLRNRKLAVSGALLIFIAFQGAVIALAMGKL